MKPKVLIGHPISPRRWKDLGDQFRVEAIQERDYKSEQVLDLIDDHDALFAVSHAVNAAIMEKGSRLKIIANYGVGYDNIDVERARQLGITVTNTPHSTAAPTAVFTMGLILTLLRKISLNDRKIREGRIGDWADPRLLGNSPQNKTLGILGLGRIGRELARRIKSIDCEVIYHNRNRLESPLERELGVSYRSKSELLREADIVSIHTPLNQSTFHMIGSNELEMMAPGSYLINTSRGSVVDHDALISALQSGHLAGAALDVFPDEPVVPAELLLMDQVVLTPHTGTGTIEARNAMFWEAWTNIKNFFSGSGPVSKVA